MRRDKVPRHTSLPTPPVVSFHDSALAYPADEVVRVLDQEAGRGEHSKQTTRLRLPIYRLVKERDGKAIESSVDEEENVQVPRREE